MVAAVSDGFSGTNGTPLGTTEVGGKTWQALVGSWTRTGGLAATSTARSSNPMAVVDLNTPNVDVQCNVSGSGSDCLYFRVVDSSNWLRLRNRRWQTSSSQTTYYTEYYYYMNYSAPDLYSGGDHGADSMHQVGMWATSPPSASAWASTMTHNHVNVNNVSWGNHLHTKDNTVIANGQSRQQSTTSTTYYTNYSVVLEKCVAGVVSTIQEFGQSDATTQLRVACQADDITIYADGTMLNTRTETTHKTGTKFGVGLGDSEYSPGSALDNFAATFVAALGWGIPL